MSPNRDGRSGREGVVRLGIAAALVVAASPLLSWIQAPITGGAGPVLAWMATPLGVLAAVTIRRRSGTLAAIAAISALALCLTTLAWLAVVDPVFWRLVDENDQYAGVMEFSFRNIPGNFQIEPVFERMLPTDTLWDRVATSGYFTGRGWWACLAGSVGALLATVTGDGLRFRALARWTVAGLGVPAVVIASGLAAERLSGEATVALMHGRYAVAIDRYERARWFAPVLAGSELVHTRIGEAFYHLGQTSHPHARFFLGRLDLRRGDRVGALAHFRLAADDALAPLRNIVTRRIAWTYVEQGVSDYRKTRRAAAAAGSWERALREDREHLMALYLVSHAWVDQGRYRESVTASEALLKRSRHPLFNAQVHLNLGDAYWKLGDVRRARHAYETSMKLDKDANYRALRSLGGT